LLAEYLEQVELYIRSQGTNGIGRLMVFMPPRHGTTEMVSKLFPAWLLGRQPDSRIILCSYNADLATKNSRVARDYVLDIRYQPVFGTLAAQPEEGEAGSAFASPVQLSDSSRSVTAWELMPPARGGVAAAGVGGGITGLGAHLLVIDDPFKNREEADSDSTRQRVMDWYRSSAYTRLEKGGAVVVMHTRWHVDDLAGQLLRNMALEPGSDRWVVLALPAVAMGTEDEGRGTRDEFEEYQRQRLMEGVWEEDVDLLGRKAGEALWPEKYNEADLEHLRVTIGAYEFEALYQQRPYLRTGGMFQRDWFPIVEFLPTAEHIKTRCRFWDKAGSMAGDGDYACGVLMSVDQDETVWVEHVARAQGTPGERDRMIRETAEFDRERLGPTVQIWHQQDPASAGLDSAQMTNKMLAKIGMTARFDTLSGSKVVRAGPWSSYAQGGGIRLVRGGWNQAFIDEHVAFPNGRYDDQVDVASWGFGKLMTMIVRKQRMAESYQG
jgi:predicted phage terminase large subunit-like protein